MRWKNIIFQTRTNLKTIWSAFSVQIRGKAWETFNRSKSSGDLTGCWATLLYPRGTPQPTSLCLYSIGFTLVFPDSALHFLITFNRARFSLSLSLSLSLAFSIPLVRNKSKLFKSKIFILKLKQLYKSSENVSPALLFSDVYQEIEKKIVRLFFPSNELEGLLLM